MVGLILKAEAYDSLVQFISDFCYSFHHVS